MSRAKFENYIRAAREGGADRAKKMAAGQVIVAEWVRMKCRYGCDGYGMGHLCPPRTPAPEEMRRMLSSYSDALIFTFEKIRGGSRHRKQREHRQLVFDLERMFFLDGYVKAFGMGCGPCTICGSCDMDEPCKRPDVARPAMEACGIDVYQTVRNAGLQMSVVQECSDPMTMVGLILIE